MKGIFQSSFIRNAATLTVFSLLLSACLTGDDDSKSDDEVAAENDDVVADNVAADNEVSGSVGDGPIINSSLRIFQNDGTEIMRLESDATAGYNIVVRTKGKYYPLSIEARGGTDMSPIRHQTLTLMARCSSREKNPWQTSTRFQRLPSSWRASCPAVSTK